MAQIVPSVLETNRADFLDTLAREMKLPGVQRIQVDFGDGVFVPNKILPITEIDLLSPAFYFEAHLMVQEPKEFLDYKIAGFKTIIVHYEAYKLPTQLRLAIEEIRRIGLEPAIALKVETPVSVLKDLEEIKHFQLMSVHPGAQGTPFLEETYGRIAELRKLSPNAIIEVDGGVNLENIKQIADAGVDLTVLGSAITKASNMQEAFEKLESALK